MSSPRLKIRCPNCQKDGTSRAELLNRRVSCKHCAHVFRAVPVDDDITAKVAPTKILSTERDRPARPPNDRDRDRDRVQDKDRIEALELEARQLRDAFATEQAEASKVRAIRDQLGRALEATKNAEERERTLREELGQLRDQLDQTENTVGVESRDRLREEELKFLRDQLDKARSEVESESRKRREAAASVTQRIAEHAQALEAQALEHAGALREALGQVDRARDETQAVEARRLEEAQALRADLDEANQALETLRLDRGRLDSDHARALDDLRGRVLALEARLAEADRSAAEHEAAADRLRLDHDRLEADRVAERSRLLGELEAAREARLDAEAALRARDEDLDSLRSRVEALAPLGDWDHPSTELEILKDDLDQPTEADLPALRPEAPTVFDGEAGRSLDGPDGLTGLEHASAIEAARQADRDRLRAEAEAESLRLELERVRNEAVEAARWNRELADRVHALEAEATRPSPAASGSAHLLAAAPVVAPAQVEAERKRAVEEAVKGAWADFERRLAETQAKLKAANTRADLMEIEAREAREQAARASGDGSSFDEPQSMTSIRILDARGTARLTLADAEARLGLARQLAVDRKDKPLIDRIAKMADKVRADLEARSYTLAETLVRGAEIETGLDPGGFSIGGLRIFRASPTIVASLSALAPAFDRATRQGDLSTVRSAIEEMRTILGDQAGLPEIRRVGRTPAIKRSIAEGEAVRLFLGALEAENWLMRPIAARKPPPDTSLTTYACLVEACSASRPAALEHALDRVTLLDSVIQASCQILLRRQQPDGHFAFLDPRGRPSRPASVVEAMVAKRPDSVKDGWVVLVDPFGLAQAETGACGQALATAGKALERPEWSEAARKAADWSANEPCLANFVANAASAGLLARAYLDAGREHHLAALVSKLTLGLLPGQVENGRWVDAGSATTPNHLAILRALHDAWEAIPLAREDLRGDLKPAIDRAMSSLLAECQALGVPPQGNALRDLLRHRGLPRLEADSRLNAAILDSATVIQELCHDGPKPKLGVAPDQLAALIRLG